MVENDTVDPNLRLAAAQVIAQVLSDRSVKKSVKAKATSQVLAHLIEYAEQGLIEVHSIIEPEDIEEQEIIGEGNIPIFQGIFKGLTL